jgi:hypothetical protein
MQQKILAHRIYDQNCHCHIMSTIICNQNGYTINPFIKEEEGVTFYSGTIIPIKRDSVVNLSHNDSRQIDYNDIAAQLFSNNIIAKSDEECAILWINGQTLKIIG